MATVIKAGQSGPVIKRLATVDLADHLAEARNSIRDAQLQSERILAAGRQQAERLHDEARKAGRDAGYRRGYVEGAQEGREAARLESVEEFRKQHADLVEDMRRAVGEIDAMKRDLKITAERELLEFSVLVARKLTFAVGRMHRESAQVNFVRALGFVSSRTDLTVRVHPIDLASIELFAPSVLDRDGATPHVRVVADDTIAPGGCTVTTDQTRVDATLETRVDELVALLLGQGNADA